MTDKHGTYFRCPHCGQRIAVKIQRPMVKGHNWGRVDWRQPVRPHRPRHGSGPLHGRNDAPQAPETVGKMLPQAKYDWAAVDWSMSTDELATLLSCPQSYVSTQRKRYAPDTVQPRKKR